MTSKGTSFSPTNFKITCTNYPSDFILDKTVAKDYFRQFGKLRKLTFKSKSRICTVEYLSKEGFLNALGNAGEYNGKYFKISVEKSPEGKKKRSPKSEKPIWVDDDEINAELEAMSGIAPKTYKVPEVVVDLTDSLLETPKLEKVRKLKRSWINEASVKPKKKTKRKEKDLAISPEQLELIKLVKSQALTIEEKFRILDARDKLIRVKLKRNTQLKRSSPTAGTCPDMCPEKERLLRETQHQVALYEQEENGKSMNQSKAIKQYSRSSADQEAPLAHELRPVGVLQMTMAYLIHNIVDMCDSNDVNVGEWFHFLWDRTRGIRKDITQQELGSQGAVELVEQCARFHVHCSARLVAEDPAVFDQKINTENLTKCLQTLKYMYNDLQLKKESCPNEAEFRAYIILLNLGDGNFMWEVQELRQEIQKSKEVQFALQVYSALDKNNYVKFFKLVYSTSYLNACILMRYFVQVRIVAIRTLLKCYTARALKTLYPLSELVHLLAFDDIESAIDFMQSYGLSINEEKTHIVLDKNTFVLPEFPYVLDRSLTIVESKRTCSVGKIICGQELPPKLYESHILQNSFDQKGYLILKDLLDESDLEEPKVIAEHEEESDLMDMKPVSQNILTDDNLFVKKEEKNVPSIFVQKVSDTDISKEPNTGSIFGTAKELLFEPTKKANSGGQVKMHKSIFSSDIKSNIFGNHGEIKSSEAGDQTDSVPPSKMHTDFSASTNIFAKPSESNSSIFAKPSSNRSIFGATIADGATKITKTPKIFPSSESKKGGFTFNLPITTIENKSIGFGNSLAPLQTSIQQNISGFNMKMPISSKDTDSTPKTAKVESNKYLEELERKKQEEKLKLEFEEQQRQKEEEGRLLEEKRKEEERLRSIKKRIQEEELKRRMEELRREEEKRKDAEINKTVKLVLDTLVQEVDKEICEQKLRKIRSNMKKRMTLKYVRKWQQLVTKNKRKRKAMDCSPVWINTKTVKESAEELYTSSQDLTLNLMKRYKYGKPLELGLLEEDKINKINLLQLTYSTLNKRFFDLKGTLEKKIFWKVEISLPDHYELRNGLTRIEETLQDALEWEERNGTIMLIEQKKPNLAQIVTYCIERQRGLYVRYSDANGIIFVAKDFHALLQRRIFENLKTFGVFTRVPIVIILQNYDKSECNLKTLIEEKIVSDYIILIESLTPNNLLNLIEEGLVFLASKVEKPPPLELDTLNSFVTKNLCTEIWKRANSFAKWNSNYKTCLRDPNIIISLYKEGLAKLQKIALNKSCFEYATFPEVFKDYLDSEIPDFLPCNYFYFPKFWKTEAYSEKLQKIFKRLDLPKWQDKWPPSSELELEVNMSKYCTKVFREPEKPFYKIMAVLLRDVDPNCNFEDITNVLWTDVIEVLSLEKLKEINLSLTGTTFENKSIFNQYIVVYDTNMLENYKTDWFYINNPVVKKNVKQQLKEERYKILDRDEIIPDLNISTDLDKTINEIKNQLTDKKNYQQMKKELDEFNVLMNDLETSIKVTKKISSKFEETLKKAIEEK